MISCPSSPAAARSFPWLTCAIEKSWSPPVPSNPAGDSSDPDHALPARSGLRPLSTLLAPVEHPASVTRHSSTP